MLKYDASFIEINLRIYGNNDAFVATVIGSGVMAENLAGGNVALALLGNTIATGAIFIVIISAFLAASLVHIFNPVVTAVMLARREVTRSLALGYIIVQIMGGVCGTIMAHVMFELDVVQLSSNLRSGPAQYFSEIVATFGLLMTILMGVKYKVMLFQRWSPFILLPHIGLPHQPVLPTCCDYCPNVYGYFFRHSLRRYPALYCGAVYWCLYRADCIE